jgi:hypothetical protein
LKTRSKRIANVIIEELMASWCAIDGGGLWRAKFHVADAAQVAAPRERHPGSGSALRASAETGPSLPLPAAVVCAKLRRVQGLLGHRRLARWFRWLLGLWRGLKGDLHLRSPLTLCRAKYTLHRDIP